MDDHIGAVTELAIFQEGRFTGKLEAEQRLHPNMLFPELKQAFLVNPHDIDGLKQAMRTAMTADHRDLSRRMRSMRKQVRRQLGSSGRLKDSHSS